MKLKILFTLIMIFICSCKSTNSVEARLIGTWKSNKELTMNFNQKHAKLTKNQTDFLNQLTGLMTIEFTENGISKTSMPDYTMKMKGKETKVDSYTDSKQQKILGFTDSSIVVESNDEILGKQIGTINFVDDNTYWVYLSNNMFDIHAREYFTRIK